MIYDRSSRATVVSNTVVRSGFSAIVLGGAGGVDSFRVHNNILDFNKNWGVAWDTCPTSGVLDHNIIYGNAVPIESGCTAVNRSSGNLQSDPLFTDLTGRNLHLQTSSPAIGYALADYTPARDYDGRSRPQGAGPDVGAYEQ